MSVKSIHWVKCVVFDFPISQSLLKERVYISIVECFTCTKQPHHSVSSITKTIRCTKCINCVMCIVVVVLVSQSLEKKEWKYSGVCYVYQIPSSQCLKYNQYCKVYHVYQSSHVYRVRVLVSQSQEKKECKYCGVCYVVCTKFSHHSVSNVT